MNWSSTDFITSKWQIMANTNYTRLAATITERMASSNTGTDILFPTCAPFAVTGVDASFQGMSPVWNPCNRAISAGVSLRWAWPNTAMTRTTSQEHKPHARPVNMTGQDKAKHKQLWIITHRNRKPLSTNMPFAKHDCGLMWQPCQSSQSQMNSQHQGRWPNHSEQDRSQLCAKLEARLGDCAVQLHYLSWRQSIQSIKITSSINDDVVNREDKPHSLPS